MSFMDDYIDRMIQSLEAIKDNPVAIEKLKKLREMKTQYNTDIEKILSDARAEQTNISQRIAVIKERGESDIKRNNEFNEAWIGEFDRGNEILSRIVRS